MHKRLWRWGIGLAVLFVFCALIRYISVDRMNLLSKSVRITSVREWGMERPDYGVSSRFYDFMGGGVNYEWVGEQKLLFFHDLIPIQAILTRRNGKPNLSLSWPHSVGTPTLYDVTNNSERKLPKLASLFRQSGGRAQFSTVTSDGLRMLWKDDKAHTHIAMLDGSRHVRIDYTGQICRPAGNSRFATFRWDEDNHKKSVIAVDRWNITDGDYIGADDFEPPANYDLMGDCAVMSNGNLATNSLHLPRAKLMLYTITPKPESVVHTFTPSLPADAEVQALVYSPDGNRLAWIINRSVPSPFAILHRWLPKFNPPSQRSASLWISGAMGEKLHEIGHIDIPSHGRNFYVIDYIRWQPDGKTISFVSNDVLYTVPAN